MSKSGSREADADADAGGGEASQRTEEGARRRTPRRGEEEEEAAAAERSADRSCVVMVAIARCSGRVELSCGEGSGRTTPSASD